MAASPRSRALGIIYDRAIVRHFVAGTLHVAAGIAVAFGYWTRPGVAPLPALEDHEFAADIPFETIAAWQMYPALPQHIEAVTLEEVGRVAADRLKPTLRTVGRFEPTK